MSERSRSEAAWEAIRKELEAHEGENSFAVSFAPIKDGSGEIFEIVDMDLLLLDPDAKPSVTYLPYEGPRSDSGTK